MKCLLYTGLALVSISALAESESVVGHWVGGNSTSVAWGKEDNWQDGVIPGRNASAPDAWGGIARFGTVPPGNWTYVSASGLTSISNIVIGADAPHIDFQQSAVVASRQWADPCIGMEPGGGVYVEEGNTAGADFWVGTKLVNCTSSNAKYYYSNNGSGTLSVRSPGIEMSKQSGQGWFEFPVYFKGTGRILLWGSPFSGCSSGAKLNLRMADSGRLVVSNSCTYFNCFSVDANQSKQHLELVSGAKFKCSSTSPCFIKSDLEVSGAGSFEIPEGQWIFTASTANWTFSCKLTGGGTAGPNWSNDPTPLNSLNLLGEANDFSWGVTAASAGQSATTVRFTKMGMTGEDSSLGKNATVSLGSKGRLYHMGGGEVTDKTLAVNGTGAVFGHLGSGTLKFLTPFVGSSVLSISNAPGAKLAFACNETTPLKFLSEAAVLFVKQDDANEEAELTIASAEFVTGVNEIAIADGVTVEFSSLAGSVAQNVNIVTEGKGAVVVKSLEAGLTPAWLTLNGKRGKVNADGVVTSLDSAVREIDARGGVIPNVPAEVVSIATAVGPVGENVTLCADSVTVLGLRQDEKVEPAKVVLGQGQVLQPGAIMISEGASSLVVAGEGSLEGTFTLQGGSLVRTNEMTGASVTLTARGDTGAELTLGGDLSSNSKLSFFETSGNLAMQGSGEISASKFSVSKGILDLGGDMSLSGTIRVASVDADNQAAVYQRSGSLNVSVNGAVAIGSKGYAYYELSGGDYSLGGQAYFGYGGQTVLSMLGGVMNQNTGNAYFGNAESLTTFYLKNGTFRQTSGNDAYVGYWGSAATGSTVLTLDGPDALFEVGAKDGTTFRNVTLGPNEGGVASTTVLNLNNGGTIHTGLLGGCIRRSTTSRVYVNANGGVLANDYLWNAKIFGDEQYYSKVDQVTLFEDGLTLKCGAPAIVNVPLSKPSGNGVSVVPWVDTEVSFIGSPIVKIEGDGAGATAYAEFDSSAQKVTGVRVTSPGWGYSEATAVVYYGTKSGVNQVYCRIPCELSESVSGGLTKDGAESAKLMFANTYTGPTVLNRGSLILGVDNAIDSASALVLNGGTLDMNGQTQAFADITCDSGAIVNGRPVVTGLVVDFDAAKAGIVKRVDINMPFDFAEGAVLTLLNYDASKLAKADKRYTLIDFVNGAPQGLDLSKIEVPEGWTLKIVGNKLKLSVVTGFALIVR